MPDPLERLATEVLVDHGTFDLIDDSGEQDAPIEFRSAVWLFAGRNQITVVSASSRHHVAAVTVEAWAAEPPALPDRPEFQDAAVRLDSGLLEINPLVDGEDAEAVQVGGPGDYRVRAYVSGRAELLAATPPPEVELRGVERYLLQIWPA